MRGGAAQAPCGDLTDTQETSVLKSNHPEAGVGIIGPRSVAARVLQAITLDRGWRLRRRKCSTRRRRRFYPRYHHERRSHGKRRRRAGDRRVERKQRAELEAGKLVWVLPDWDFGSMEMNALFANGKTIKPAARAFADFLLRELRAAEDGSGQGIAVTAPHSRSY